MRRVAVSLLSVLIVGAAFGQQSGSRSKHSKAAVSNGDRNKSEIIPERKLSFSPVDGVSNIVLPPVTSLPQCDSGGALVLDMLDPADLKKHTVISVHDGKRSARYTPSAISDLHDVTMFSFFPSESVVGLLVRGTKESQVPLGPGVSPAGYAWSGYHTFIAEFDRDGSYRHLVEVPLTYQVSRLAILPSGEFLVAGFDKLNGAPRLLLLDSSGQIKRTIDAPTFRKSPDADAQYGSIDAEKAARKIMGPLVFTSYGQSILVWSRNSNDPILEIGSGGSVREVPMTVPKGYTFVDLIPANDRWVAHFRLTVAPEDSPFNKDTYSYFELRPQDASVSSKLSISGDLPSFLACESDGHYITYKADKDNRLVLYRSE